MMDDGGWRLLPRRWITGLFDLKNYREMEMPLIWMVWGRFDVLCIHGAAARGGLDASRDGPALYGVSVCLVRT